MVGGLIWEAFSGNWGPRVLWVGGSLWLIGALWFENWKLKTANGPRLSLVFKAGEPLYETLQGHDDLRIFRLGVLNTGAPARNVAVKVSRVHPVTPHLYPMLELRQTHEDGRISRFDVNKSGLPIVFVDFIWQEIRRPPSLFPVGETSSMSIAYVGHGERLPLTNDHYLIWVVIDGDGAEPERKFVLRRNPSGQYDLSVALFG